MNYYEAHFTLDPLLPAREVLIAQLAEAGFDSFVETDDGLLAYIPENLYRSDFSENLIIRQESDVVWNLEVKRIEDQNWNAEWEKNFEPVVVNDACIIRAPFHTPDKAYTFDLVIEPKMSFGTGHHSTTRLMCLEIINSPMQNTRVLDMGCGTGVLAILAEKSGATSVDAIDIDPWSFENTLENVARNNCTRIQVACGDSSLLNGKTYDVILANINRNILLADIPKYMNCLVPGGSILLSGFFTSDADVLAGVLSKDADLVNRCEESSWCMLHFRKKPGPNPS